MKRILSVGLLAVLVLAAFVCPAAAADSKTEPIEIVETIYNGEQRDWVINAPTAALTPETASAITGIPLEEVGILWTRDYDTDDYPADITIDASGTDGLDVFVLEYVDGAWVLLGTGLGPMVTVPVTREGTISVVTRIPIFYEVTKGMGGVWYQTSAAPLPFTCVRNIDDPSAYSHFTGIEVDGETIDPGFFTAVPGSVVLELHPEYLSTLALGEHQLTYRFDDGQAGTNFFVRPVSDHGTTPAKDTTAKAPKTGDPVWGIAAAAAAGALLCGALVKAGRKEH